MENLHKTAFRLLYNLHAVDSSESRYFTFWIARPKKKEYQMKLNVSILMYVMYNKNWTKEIITMRSEYEKTRF